VIPGKAGLWQSGRLWSLWDMLELKVGRLLELHERLTIEKGYFERRQHELTKAGSGHIRFEPTDLQKLTDTVSEIEQVSRSVGLTSTQQAGRSNNQRIPISGALRQSVI